MIDEGDERRIRALGCVGFVLRPCQTVNGLLDFLSCGRLAMAVVVRDAKIIFIRGLEPHFLDGDAGGGFVALLIGGIEISVSDVARARLRPGRWRR